MSTEQLPRVSDADRDELLSRAAERGGYLLASEIAELTDTLEELEAVFEALTADHEGEVVLVDDLGEDEAPELPSVGYSGDPVRQYLNEASRYELLDFEREQDLAKRYAAGIAAAGLLTPDLDGRTRRKLEAIVADGTRSREHLVRSNLRLVIPTAKKYAGNDLPMIEAIQEGNLGLIRAVEKFDHTKGYKFSTYAVWWIRQAIQRGLAKRGRTIRVPSSIWEQSGKVRRTEGELRTKFGRDPDDHEVAEATGLSVSRIQEIRDALQPLTSLDRPVGESGNASLGDLLHDAQSADPSSDSVEADLRSRLDATLAELPERERTIIELRFGLRGGEPCTLEQAGDAVGLTRERVRQLERDALRKLRDPAAAHGLQEALGLAAA